MEPKVNKSRSKKRAKRNTRNDAKLSHCTRCGFTSKRAFNVIRHYARIHEPVKRKLKCCGQRFVTKGHYYQHCADTHPERRRSTAVSSTRYKITTSPVKREMKNLRRSSKRVKPKKEDFHLDENTPLIYYVKNPEVFKKEEDIKSEDYHELELEDCRVRIIFEGDATSPVHSRILNEFLSNIDFDRFKLIK